jgi:NSS family neurotransmitter:Na+ symporter
VIIGLPAETLSFVIYHIPNIISSQNTLRWSSRSAFYFAAVGSAVGFGNVWRFPTLVYEYGGGAFFIPYVMALVFVGIPILVLEIALGQYYETGGEFNLQNKYCLYFVMRQYLNALLCFFVQMSVYSVASTKECVESVLLVWPAAICL